MVWVEIMDEDYEERAAIMQYDGGMSREQAESAARAEWIKSRKP
jgi:hypothetical protein